MGMPGSCAMPAAGGNGSGSWYAKRLEKAKQCLDLISAQSDAAADRLKAFVEEPRP